MEKNFTFSIILGILFLVSSALPAEEKAGKPEIIRKPAMETFVHSGTGLSFPPRIESFEKIMVRVHPQSEIGTVISYENETGAMADIYIYRSADPFSVHADETKTRILNSASLSKYIRAVDELPFKQPDGVFAVQFRLKLENESLLSRLYLFSVSGHLVKVRITWPEDQEEDTEAADAFGDCIYRQIYKEKTIPTGVNKK